MKGNINHCLLLDVNINFANLKHNIAANYRSYGVLNGLIKFLNRPRCRRYLAQLSRETVRGFSSERIVFAFHATVKPLSLAEAAFVVNVANEGKNWQISTDARIIPLRLRGYFIPGNYYALRCFSRTM